MPDLHRVLLFAIHLGLFAAIAPGCKGAGLGPPRIKDTVNVTVDKGGFSPDRIYAQRGRPITLVFNRVEERTCATEVVIASEHIRKELPMNTPVSVVFIPGKTGDIHFACPMNMVTGTISVVN